jgi:transposase
MNSSSETVAYWYGDSRTMPKRRFRPRMAFIAPYLAHVREDAPQRNHNLREVFNGLMWIERAGSAWRYMPHDLPLWEAIYQQTRRWQSAGLFEVIGDDLRVRLRFSEGSASAPTATLALYAPSRRAALGAATTERKKGSKVHAEEARGRTYAAKDSAWDEDSAYYLMGCRCGWIDPGVRE